MLPCDAFEVVDAATAVSPKLAAMRIASTPVLSRFKSVLQIK